MYQTSIVYFYSKHKKVMHIMKYLYPNHDNHCGKKGENKQKLVCMQTKTNNLQYSKIYPFFKKFSFYQHLDEGVIPIRNHLAIVSLSTYMKEHMNKLSQSTALLHDFDSSAHDTKNRALAQCSGGGINELSVPHLLLHCFLVFLTDFQSRLGTDLVLSWLSSLQPIPGTGLCL